MYGYIRKYYAIRLQQTYVLFQRKNARSLKFRIKMAHSDALVLANEIAASILILYGAIVLRWRNTAPSKASHSISW